MDSILVKYARLLCHYCLELKASEKLYIRSTFVAEDLVREVYREAIKMGAHVEYDLDFRGKNSIYFNEANDEQLMHLPSTYEKAMNSFDAYLNILAPYNLKEGQGISASKRNKRSKALKAIQDIYFQRTANKSLKRSLCLFPNLASAQEANMSLEDYQKFVFNACHLYDESPENAWLQIRKEQEQIVQTLNTKKEIRYVNDKSDIRFSVNGRTWINSDGRANMPSGEVFSSPVENSVQGVIHFDFPSIFMGNEVEGITLHVKDGYVESWDAIKGSDILNEVFSMEGARYFGEVAIGTNYNIQQSTKNILFDEKIGGTVHMAVGQTYLQTGGKNQSPIHWDMIADMRNSGEIYADGEKIYEKGKFII